MKFNYQYLLNRCGYSGANTELWKTTTGYGVLYSRYKLAQQNYLTSKLYENQEIHINQCDYNLRDLNINNCFVIFQSDYLPKTFLDTINKQSGIILVNSQWMKNVVLQQTNCNKNRLFKLPYLQNFDYYERPKKIKQKMKYDKLNFYMIADWKNVKNIQGLIKAFKLAFSSNNDVQLTIKTSRHPSNQQNIIISQLPKIEIINKMLTPIQIIKMHINNQIYISSAFCVGWQIPPFISSYLGNILMCGQHSAFTQWVDFNKAIKFQSTKKLLPFDHYNQFTNKYKNMWQVNDITIQQIVQKLRYVYSNIDNLRINNKNMDLTRFDVKNINDYYFILN